MKEEKEKGAQHELLGLFIAEQLKRAHLNILEMCDEIDMGPNTYEGLKGGSINI